MQAQAAIPKTLAITGLVLAIGAPYCIVARDMSQRGTAATQVADGPREAIVYHNATSVRIFRNHAVMGGFRFRGQYTRSAAPTFPIAGDRIASVARDLGAELSAKPENWYALFVAANDDDDRAVLRIMPFLRVGARQGTTLTLMNAGEGIHAASARAHYRWKSENNLVNSEILLASENGAYSGRVTKITHNNESTIKISHPGNLSYGDFILPSPPGYSNYVYIASFYFDTKEVRNIYDSGTIVKAKMIPLQQPSIKVGEYRAPGLTMNFAGYIAPLATAVTLSSSGALSTASLGGLAEYFDVDGGGHVVDTRYIEKTSHTTQPYVFGNVQIPFLYYQKLNYYNAGQLAKTRVAGQLDVTGWIEP